jgi:hypothetical protein
MRRLTLPTGIVAALLILLAAGGCSSDIGPSRAELKAQWDAQNVYPQNYKDDLLAFLRTYLNDPSHVREAGVSQPMLKSVGPGERFVACVRYNARALGGGYAGVHDAAVIFVSGKLDRFVDGGKHLEGGKAVKELCKDVAYAPFPELERLTR